MQSHVDVHVRCGARFAAAIRMLLLSSLLLSSLFVPLAVHAQDAPEPVVQAEPQPPAHLPLEQTQDGCGVRTINVTISLYRVAPAGSALRRQYEQAIRYFADGIYEATNCAHIVGKVSIYQRGKAKDTADVVWVREEHPAAYVSGYRRTVGSIAMADIYNEQNMTTIGDEGARNLGYTLAHEWGHAFYSLYDEYRGDDPLDRNNPGSPARTDTPIRESLMHNPDQGFNRANPRRYAWLNFSADYSYENIPFNRTAHGRVYAASAWDTLVRRPSQDPPQARTAANYPRFYYPELANFAPDGEHIIDLPNSSFDAVNRSGNPARAKLRIVWFNTETARVFAVNTANASGGNQLEVIIEALEQEIYSMPLGSAVGVIGFDTTAQVVIPITRLTSNAVRETLLDTLFKDLQTGTGTTGNVSLALQRAYDMLEQHPPYINGDDVGSVFLLSGAPLSGMAGVDAVLQDYQADDLQIYTFGVEVSFEDDELLYAIAEATAGLHAFVVGVDNTYDDVYAFDTAVSELVAALADARFDAEPLVETLLEEGSQRIQPRRTVTREFFVDETLTAINVYASVSPTATLTLSSPSGGPPRSPDFCFTPSSGGARPNVYCKFTVPAPVTGTWQLQAQAGTAAADLFYEITGEPGDDNATFTSRVDTTGSDIIRYPQPIILKAAVEKTLPMSGLRVVAELILPNGEPRSFPMLDDGVAPDELKDDGIYTGIVSNYPANGTYGIRVRLDNSAGTGKLTHGGLATAPGPFDPETGLPLFPVPDPTPVITNFTRLARTNVLVTGFRADDHGNTPATATVLPAFDVNVFGKVDQAGDVDFFRINVPVTFTGELTVRLTNLLDGMQPRLRIFAADGTTELRNVELAAEETTLRASVPPAPGGSYFAAVTHTDPAADRGVYTLSAGAPLPSEGLQLSSLRALPRTIPADGTTTAGISATVMLDSAPAAGQAVTLTTTLGRFTDSNTTTVVVNANENGFLTTTLVSAEAGVATIQATAGTNTRSVTLTLQDSTRRVYLPLIVRVLAE